MEKSDNSGKVVEGNKAPAFTLPRDGGTTISLKEYAGKNVIVFFYPKDDTSGCTKEAIGFSEAQDAFRATNTEIIGVSADSVASHDKFKAKHSLDLVLVSDEEKKMIEDYGVWVEKNMYGRKYMGIERATFLLDPKGNVINIWRKVKVKGHVDAVLKAAQELA